MRSFYCRGTLLAFLTIFLAGFVVPTLHGQSAGPNVNMVSGTGWTNGDPFLQRQNEPSIADSRRQRILRCDRGLADSFSTVASRLTAELAARAWSSFRASSTTIIKKTA